ncbi:putative PWWP domain-containing protein [Rosa chinensis]|uniref:Putative PWWP domain-containing protein n=1 Tax=Rosa chinensis TaxID=74649 RepID=A0A2P6SPQ0_ROSCH|nr:uncharacterized protein At1g51745 [Rosa chinensis]PRQ60674.1 putative PWWP domain-containing protein [Rosa chinensis]
MESTDSGDFSVGSIVWVRRRNGSWWPGKIVGPEELSTSHLTSPRSGTPVKLLGREDASVDWYNLEKSKRVKPFRCGDFDDCIHKAESAQGMPPKKREKYARREDAILHALELERQLLRKQGKSTSEYVNSKYGAVKEAVIPSESLGKDHSKLGNSKSHQLYKRKDSFHKKDIIGSPLPSQRLKEGTQLSGEDDRFEVTPRMRGLQDFGLKIASSKRKLSSSSTSNGFWKPTIDGTYQAFAHGGLSLGGTSHVNGVEQTGAICRAKRSKCVYLPADSGDSLEYEAAPAGHIEISASPIGTRLHAESLIEDNTSGFTEDLEESNFSETDSSDHGSDSSETEPDMDEEMPSFSDPEVGRYEAQERRSLIDEEPDESTHSGDMPHLYNQDPYFASEAVSKWQLKGKRNTRNLSKRSIDTTEGRGYFYGPYSEEKAEMSGMDDGYPLSRAASRSRNRVGLNMIDWEDGTWEDRSAWDECWDIKRERFDPVYDDRYNHRRRPKYLIDVDLKVQASYQKEPVPIVSLMSKLNGKAIIGHPIQVEALEDGLSNTLLSTFDDSGEEAIDNDGGTTLPHAWRTARRTANVRVPRPHLFSTLDGDEAADDLPFFDEGRPPFKKLNMGSSSHKASQVRRNPPHNSRLLTDRKFSKKVSKKVSLSSSLKTKTRTLSSLAIQQNYGNKGMIQYDSGGQRDRLVKPESSVSVPTTVACIPVKLVFSRLLEKINRPPSKATAAAASNAVLLNGDVERS